MGTGSPVGGSQAEAPPERRVGSTLFLAIVALLLVSGGYLHRLAGTLFEPVKDSIPELPMNIGYFHGGRTNLFFRSYINEEFKQAGLDVVLSTRNLYNATYFPIKTPWKEAEVEMDRIGMDRYGKITGVELIRQIDAGNIHAGMIGESSFLSELARDPNLPIVAVATLGHDTVEMPGHCICFRRDVKVRKPSDMKGLRFSSRRAGPGDEVMLREFISSEGLDPNKDVVIKDCISDDKEEDMLMAGEFDGGYYHLMSARKMVEDGKVYVYRPLNWVPANLSLALLVFHKDYVARHRDEIIKMLAIYSKRVAYENSLPSADRTRKRKKGQQMAESFLGMNYPQCDIPAIVEPPLLEKMQEVLLKHRMMKSRAIINPHVDNSLVLEATKQAGLPTDGSYHRVSP